MKYYIHVRSYIFKSIADRASFLFTVKASCNSHELHINVWHGYRIPCFKFKWQFSLSILTQDQLSFNMGSHSSHNLEFIIFCRRHRERSFSRINYPVNINITYTRVEEMVKTYARILRKKNLMVFKNVFAWNISLIWIFRHQAQWYWYISNWFSANSTETV